MKKTLATLLVLGIAANAAFLAWQLWSAPGTTQTVASTSLVVMRTPGGLLEVSAIKSVEQFESSTDHTIYGVPVGKTIAQIRVPAVYRYHIPLAKQWSIKQTGNALLVIAPAVVPSLPVAIDTAKLESFSAGNWSPFVGTREIALLQKSITPTLANKASQASMVNLQREMARTTVSEFVRKWVVQQPQWMGAKTPAVLVFFEDEALGKTAAPLLEEQL